MRRSDNRDEKIWRLIWLVVGILFAVAAIQAVCTGHIKMGKFGGEDIYSATDPIAFWLSVAFCALFGSIGIFFFLKKL